MPLWASNATVSMDEGAKLLEMVSQLYHSSAETFPTQLLTGLGRLIPFELGGCHAMDDGERLIMACYQPEEIAFAPVRHKEFWRLAKTHPLNPLLFANPGRAFMLSDAISLKAFVETELYDLFYRPLHVNRELVARLPTGSAGSGGFLLISFHRWGSEFSERDRALLNLLLPHVSRAWQRLIALLTSAPASEGAMPGFEDERAFCEWTRQATEWRLTRRESDVLFWLSQGKTNAEIGRILGMAERTAETHALRLYRKIGVENRYSAIAMISRISASGGKLFRLETVGLTR
jgi:DNA-binding CsgD family transcriptional regulator